MKLNLNKILRDGAKKKLVRVLICEGWDERSLTAASQVANEGLAKPIVLGNLDEIKKLGKKLKLDISKVEVVDFKNSELKNQLAEKLVQIRKHKGMTIDKASKLLEDENYFGVMYTYAGYADAVAGSTICSTAALMRPALQILRKPNYTVSEVAIVDDPKNKHTLIMTDASLNISPTAPQLSQIALNAIIVAQELGMTPKVGFLSYSTKGSGGDGDDLLLIREAVELTKKTNPKLAIDGELQFDAAVNSKAAARKCPNSPLRGEANVIVFPGLEAANIFCHGVMQFSQMDFEFTVLKGMQKPVAILGRSTPQHVVTNMIIGCAMQVNND